MSPKELNELKINALALRNIAGKVLVGRAVRKKEYRSTNQNKKEPKRDYGC